MRSMWSGYVSFGLVTIPVKLYAATEDVRTPLHEVHTCGSRIRHRRVCEREQREVPQDEIRRGWQAPDGEVVVLGAEDLEHLPLPTLKTAEVLGFVVDDDVDPLMYDRPYWAGPAGDAAQRPYALLVEADGSYDADLNRFFRSLPTSGCRSPNNGKLSRRRRR